MRKVLLSVATLLGSIFVFVGFLRLLPDEYREKFSRLLGAMMTQMMESMPDE